MSNFRQYHLKVRKINKQTIEFESDAEIPEFKTQIVRIEKFQGFSGAKGCKYYFRVKDQSSWDKSTKITGLWYTQRPGVYSGDVRTEQGKTLMLFKVDDDWQTLTVYLFPNGFNPVWQIGSIIKSL